MQLISILLRLALLAIAYACLTKQFALSRIIFQLLLIVAFHFFSSPFNTDNRLNKYKVPTGLSYWLPKIILWLFMAMLYHLPPVRNAGVDLRPFVGLAIPVYVASLLGLFLFHRVYHAFNSVMQLLLPGIWKGRGRLWSIDRPSELWQHTQTAVYITMLSCLFYVQCGSEAARARHSPWYGNWSSLESWNDVIGLTLGGAASGEKIAVQWSQGFCGIAGDWTSDMFEESHHAYWMNLQLNLVNFVREKRGEEANLEGLKSPVFTLWCTLMSICIVNGIMERTNAYQSETMKSTSFIDGTLDGKKDEETEPEFEEMTSWYSHKIFQTVVQLVISTSIFLHRFDIRQMQAAFRPKLNQAGAPQIHQP